MLSVGVPGLRCVLIQLGVAVQVVEIVEVGHRDCGQTQPRSPQFDETWHSRILTPTATAGAHALLVVTPYYSKPPQAGLLQHFRAVADSCELPVVIYDIPGRSGVPVQTETMIELAQHDRIVAVKDAKGDLSASSKVIA